MDRETAVRLLDQLHDAQQEFHRGGSGEELRRRLDVRVMWHVPGVNAIAGAYSGIDEVMEYFARRRALTGGTFRTHRCDVLTGEADMIAALTDGIARIADEEHRWSTVGLYRFRGDKLAECWLLPLDPRAFDRIWSNG